MLITRKKLILGEGPTHRSEGTKLIENTHIDLILL